MGVVLLKRQQRNAGDTNTTHRKPGENRTDRVTLCSTTDQAMDSRSTVRYVDSPVGSAVRGFGGLRVWPLWGRSLASKKEASGEEESLVSRRTLYKVEKLNLPEEVEEPAVMRQGEDSYWFY